MGNKTNTKRFAPILLFLIILLSCSNNNDYTFNSFNLSFPNIFSLKEIKNEHCIISDLNYIKDCVVIGDEDKDLYINFIEYDISDEESEAHNYNLEDVVSIIKNNYHFKQMDKVYRVFEDDNKVILRAYHSSDPNGIQNISMAYYKNYRLQKIEVQTNGEDYDKYKSIIIEFLKKYEMNNNIK